MDLDTQTGMDALLIFHNQSARYPAYQGRSFEDLLGVYGKKAEIYAEGIGLAIRVNNMSWGSVRMAMEGLANKAQGRIPKDHQEFIKYLGNQAAEINWIDLTKTVVTEVSAQVVAGAQNVGNSVLTSFSWVLKILPFLVVGGVIYYVARLVGADQQMAKAATKVASNVAKSVQKRVKKAVSK
jgi:hypothetical protein